MKEGRWWNQAEKRLSNDDHRDASDAEILLRAALDWMLVLS